MNSVSFTQGGENKDKKLSIAEKVCTGEGPEKRRDKKRGREDRERAKRVR